MNKREHDNTKITPPFSPRGHAGSSLDQRRVAATAKRHIVRYPLHLLMISIAAIFLFPFLWMLLTSLKTDQEIAGGQFFPAFPRFRSAPAQPLEIYELQIRTLDA